MTITDRLTEAIRQVLADSSLPGDPEVTAGIETVVNEEESMRVIVTATSSELRKLLLPGNYDVTGEVTVFMTIDTQENATTDLKALFRSLCDAVEEIVGQKHFMPMSLQSADEKLNVYSWNLTGQDSFMQSRAMGAKFNWTCYVRQDSHNPN
jgi:hypothetical protein